MRMQGAQNVVRSAMSWVHDFKPTSRGVDEPERSGAALRHLVFIRNARSGTYCQISRNALYRAFRHLFVTGQKKVVQYFEETRIFWEIIKRVISRFSLERSSTSEVVSAVVVLYG